ILSEMTCLLNGDDLIQHGEEAKRLGDVKREKAGGAQFRQDRVNMPVHAQQCQTTGEAVCPRGGSKLDTLLSGNGGIVETVNEDELWSSMSGVWWRRL